MPRAGPRSVAVHATVMRAIAACRSGSCLMPAPGAAVLFKQPAQNLLQATQSSTECSVSHLCTRTGDHAAGEGSKNTASLIAAT